MPQTLIPVHLKPHLVPFLFKKLKCVDTVYEGREVKAAKVNNKTSFGRFVRLLLEKSQQKVKCDKSSQTFFLVQEYAKPVGLMKSGYKYEDGRAGFLTLPPAGELLINEYLEEEFETASMFFIHARHQAEGDKSLDSAIIDFFEKYNLEEFNYNIPRIRRAYYRKLESGYFAAKVLYNPLSNKLERSK